jgi:hypothetical protein
MKYKGYEIMAECQTDTAVYRLNDKGELGEWHQNIDTEPTVQFYGIFKDDNVIDWVDAVEGIEGAKSLIDWHIKHEESHGSSTSN